MEKVGRSGRQNVCKILCVYITYKYDTKLRENAVTMADNRLSLWLHSSKYLTVGPLSWLKLHKTEYQYNNCF